MVHGYSDGLVFTRHGQKHGRIDARGVGVGNEFVVLEMLVASVAAFVVRRLLSLWLDG